MAYERICLVHYHEIGLKGKNRSTFENQLVTNLRCTLRDLPVKRVCRISGHLLVDLEPGADAGEISAIVRQVPGVARASIAYRCPREPEV